MQTHAGFTLIELMITVALLAIITAVSVSSYRQYMVRANRTDGTAFLLRIAAAQERWYLDNNRYSADADTELRIGPTSEHGYYEVTINLDANPAAGYTAVATPAAGGRQYADADCQQLSINETGLRDSTPAGIGVCWR